MPRILMLTAVLLLANASSAFASVTVNCDQGESLNRALSRLDKRGPNTVRVKGTCAEYVQLRGFEDLNLKGQTGATLVQPHDPPAVGIFALLDIDASQRVTIDGFKVQAQNILDLFAISVHSGSTDIRLRNMTIEGGAHGIFIFGRSQVYVERVTARNPGWATVSVYDLSDVHVKDSLFEGHTVPGFWNVGIATTAGLVTVGNTTIRNMQEGIQVDGGGIVNVAEYGPPVYDPTDGPSEVVIESPLGTNFHGLKIDGGGTVTLFGKLRITNAGQSWGGDSGAVLVSGGSRLNAGNQLEVTGSQGQGVFVSHDSYAILDGSSITGSFHNGLVVVNNSSVSVGSSALTRISGNNRKDVFCDSRSLITGGANIGGATNVQCSNLLANASEPIP